MDARNTSGRRKRVAIVYHFFAHYRGAVLRELLDNGRHLYVLVGDTTDPDAGAGAAIKAWDGIEQLPPGRFERARNRRLPGGALWQRGVVGLALSRKYDSIIYLGNAGYVSTWISAALARLAGKRVLMWTHGWTRPEGGAKALVRKTFYRHGHALLLYGHVAKCLGIDRGLRPGRMHVIYNSLDVNEQRRLASGITEARRQAVRERFARPELPLLVATGRLTQVKQLHLLIEAAAGLTREGFPVNLLVVGDGPERPALEAQAAKLNVSTDFRGAVYDEVGLAAIHAAADVAVIPGDVGLSAMHAMGYGTPVVSHDRPWGQMPEWESIVPGKTGDLFAAGDSASLQAVLRKWLTNALRREAVRAACFDMVDRFWNPAVQRKLIDRAVDGEEADDLLAMRRFEGTIDAEVA